MDRARADLDEAAWTESADRFDLEDGFSVVPVSDEPGGHSGAGLGWNLYAPGCTAPFAWAATLVEMSEKIAREHRERLFTRALCYDPIVRAIANLAARGFFL